MRRSGRHAQRSLTPVPVQRVSAATAQLAAAAGVVHLPGNSLAAVSPARCPGSTAATWRPVVFVPEGPEWPLAGWQAPATLVTNPCRCSGRTRSTPRTARRRHRPPRPIYAGLAGMGRPGRRVVLLQADGAQCRRAGRARHRRHALHAADDGFVAQRRNCAVQLALAGRRPGAGVPGAGDGRARRLAAAELATPASRRPGGR